MAGADANPDQKGERYPTHAMVQFRSAQTTRTSIRRSSMYVSSSRLYIAGPPASPSCSLSVGTLLSGAIESKPNLQLRLWKFEISHPPMNRAEDGLPCRFHQFHLTQLQHSPGAYNIDQRNARDPGQPVFRPPPLEIPRYMCCFFRPSDSSLTAECLCPWYKMPKPRKIPAIQEITVWATSNYGGMAYLP